MFSYMELTCRCQHTSRTNLWWTPPPPKKTCLHMLHHVKLCSNYFSIGTEKQRLRNRETQRMQSFLDTKLPLHLQANIKSENPSDTCAILCKNSIWWSMFYKCADCTNTHKYWHTIEIATRYCAFQVLLKSSTGKSIQQLHRDNGNKWNAV